MVGDWNGDGIDTPGVFRPSTGSWLLADGTNVDDSTPPASFQFSFGQAGDLPIAGDFDGNGLDGVAVFRPSTGQFFLNDFNISTIGNAFFSFGQNGDLPLAGD